MTISETQPGEELKAAAGGQRRPAGHRKPVEGAPQRRTSSARPNCTFLHFQIRGMVHYCKHVHAVPLTVPSPASPQHPMTEGLGAFLECLLRQRARLCSFLSRATASEPGHPHPSVCAGAGSSGRQTCRRDTAHGPWHRRPWLPPHGGHLGRVMGASAGEACASRGS